MKNLFAVLLSAGLVFCAFADDTTLGFWAFKDGAVGEDAGTIDKTSGSCSNGVGTAYMTSASAGVLPTFSDDVPGTVIFGSMAKNLICTNPQSLKFTYNDNVNSNNGGYVDFAGLSTSLSALTNYTVEMFVKLDPDWTLYDDTSSWTWRSKSAMYVESAVHSYKLVVPANDSKQINLQAYYVNKTVTAGKSDSSSYNDGDWHHVAVVYHGDTCMAELFVDYTSAGAISYTNELLTSSASLILGTGKSDKRSTERYRGKIACLRASSAALGMAGFMRAATATLPSDALLGFWPFKDGEDGATVSTVTNAASADWGTGEAGLVSTAGVMPKFSSDRPGQYVYSAHLGGSVIAEEPQSVYFSTTNNSGGGKIELAEISTTLSFVNDYTIEYFFKDEDTNRYYRTSLGYYTGTNTACKLITHASGPTVLGFQALKNVSNPSSMGYSSYSSADRADFNCLDGAWHHVAIVYTASNTTATLYVDYDTAHPKSLVYTNELQTASKPLTLGTSALLVKAITEAFMGRIACPRVMTRALDPDEFLMATDSAVDPTVVFAWNFEEGSSGSEISAAQGYPSFSQNSEVPYVIGDTQPTYSSAAPRPGSRVFWGSECRNTNNVCAEFWGYQKATELTTIRIYAGATLRQPRATFAGQNPTNWTMEAYVKVRDQQSLWNTSGTGILIFGKAGNISPQQTSPERLYPRYCWWLEQKSTGELKLVWREVNGDEQGLEANAVTAASYLGDDTWHHIALTYDAALKTFKLYVDATLVLTQTLDDPLWDGPYEYDFARGLDIYGFEGYMDEIRFSNVVREPSDFVSLLPSSGLLIMLR